MAKRVSNERCGRTVMRSHGATLIAARPCHPSGRPDGSRAALMACGHRRVMGAGQRPGCEAAATRTSERAPARFGRLKDDATVLVVDVDLRSEAVRQAAKSKGSCCVVC